VALDELEMGGVAYVNDEVVESVKGRWTTRQDGVLRGCDQRR